jgi:hypothetical protein
MEEGFSAGMTAQKEKDSVTFGYYLVAFVDVLGQKEKLLRFKDLPETEEENKEFIEILKETFGVIDEIRRAFDGFYTSYSIDQEPPYLMTEQQRKTFHELQKCEIKFQRFADTIIVYVLLADKINKVPIHGVYAALLACASTFFFSLAGKHPLRVGIEVGWGAEMYEGEIYGQALYEAYRLESEVAQYPRIIIGDELAQYLIDKSRLEGSDIVAEVNREAAKLCLGLISQDFDGYPILDYLGKGLQRIIPNAFRRDEIADAQEFLFEQAKRWKQERNTKLSFRYALANAYFLSRLPLWQEIPD